MFLKIALQNLRQGGRRTWLLGIALAIVSALLILLLSLSNGINASLVKAATAFTTGHVNVSGFFKSSPTAAAAPIVTDMSKVKAIVEKNTPGVRFVIDRHRGWAKLVSETSSVFAGLIGIDAVREKYLFDVLKIAPTSAYMETGGTDELVGDVRKLAEPKTCALFAAQAKRLGIRVGDQVTIRTETLRGMSNTTDATVVAVLEDMGLVNSWSMFVPTKTILSLYGIQEDSTGAIMIYLDDIAKADEVLAHLRGVLSDAGYPILDHDPRPFFVKFEVISGQDWDGQQLDLTIWKDEVSFMEWVLTALDSISFILVFVLTVIIALGIMNTLWIAVRERTREIGTLRAIGMSRRGILILFVLEATLLGILATTIGVAVSGVLALGLDALGVQIPVAALRNILMSETFQFVVVPNQLVLTILGFTFFCALASVLPAMRAARLPPITAIHQTE
ncbi:MAG: FtsX-like permease family protein [Myxococcota bacterium]|nr:FtsX-like permease family protein [Myxococcota bacterium]